MIFEKAYAKVNLSLKVEPEVVDGYHQIETLMSPITLFDTLKFKKRNDEKIVVKGINIQNNSILKAAYAFQSKYHTKGVTITCKKRIPIEAGLAGGSADSSATLRGLNRLFKLNVSLNELKELADMLGSDNAFTLFNKAAIGRNRGEDLSFIDYKYNFNILLVKPNFGISTKKAYDAVKKNNYTNELQNLLEALNENNYEKLNENIFNDLFDSAIFIEPKLLEIKSQLEKFAKNVHMSGSGSTLFIISKDKKQLKKIKKLFKMYFSGIYLLKNSLS